MLLLLHISVALASVAASTLALLRPTQASLHSTYGLTALTLASGTMLIIANPAHWPQTCVTGLLYVAVVGALTLSARWRLARQHERQR